jgi:hypothetical protein
MKDWKALLGAVAPGIATALGGPLAGAVTAQVSRALLGRDDATDAELAEALAAPDAAIRLRELNNALEAERNRHTESVMLADNADRDSARRRQVEVKDNTPRLLALLTSAMVVGCIGLLFSWPVPAENRDVLYMLTGQVVVGWMMAMSYFLGTTSRSATKDQTISRMSA